MVLLFHWAKNFICIKKYIGHIESKIYWSVTFIYFLLQELQTQDFIFNKSCFKFWPFQINATNFFYSTQSNYSKTFPKPPIFNARPNVINFWHPNPSKHHSWLPQFWHQIEIVPNPRKYRKNQSTCKRKRKSHVLTLNLSAFCTKITKNRPAIEWACFSGVWGHMNLVCTWSFWWELSC